MLQPVIDWLSQRTGIRALPEPLPYSSNADEVTLDVPGYCQVDSFSCGAVAGYMILKTFKPKTDFDAFYRRVDPCPENGCGTIKLVKALRSSGIGAQIHARLTVANIRKSIDDGFPIITTIHNPTAESAHWVVIYGYGKRPARVFLATNGIPFFNRKVVSVETFRSIWKPKGNGLICWGK
jgi:hypothetical protein